MDGEVTGVLIGQEGVFFLHAGIGCLDAGITARDPPGGGASRKRRFNQGKVHAMSTRRDLIKALPALGAPNYFDDQRFGSVTSGSAFIAKSLILERYEEALKLANDTEYGLISYVYSEDLKRAIRFAEGIEAGMVGINRGLLSDPAAPFGGVKQSGLGREGGFDGVHEFLQTKYIGVEI